MLFHSSLLLTNDPGPVYDNIYVFRVPIFEEITAVVEQVNQSLYCYGTAEQ